ncbi:MAG: alpha/beta hydrolase fold family protein [Ramlibacter sp.]|nr:alpha/beta hydrolase fold family protein [Ramlibacter sp.]
MISYPASIDGIATRVLESGAEGPPIVFIHGTATRADRWAANLDAQARAGRHAFALDLPGHGFAAKGSGVACSVPAYAEFVGRFLDQLGSAPAILVGTSLGGHVAAMLAVRQPQKVGSIVLVGSMGLIPIGSEARQRIKGGANNQTREGVALKFSRVVHDPSLVTQDLLDEEFRINNSPGAKESLAALGNYIAASLDDDTVSPALAALALPKLLVWGDKDQTVAPSVGAAAHALLRGSVLAVIRDTAHSPYFENPLAFNRVLDDFFAGTLGEQEIPGVEVRRNG